MPEECVSATAEAKLDPDFFDEAVKMSPNNISFSKIES